MSKVHKVLAAVDFSEPARAAFDRALAVSRLHDAELTVVHAVPTEEPFKWYGRERRDLFATLRAAAKAAGVGFKFSVQSGDPAGVILLHASSRQPDLIVLGATERSGLDRFRFGSVAETVALEATQPVLVVPATAREAAQLTPPLESILVAVDFAKGSREAVERALSIASATTRVTLLHVIPGAPLAGTSRYMYRLMEPEYQRQLARDAWRRIAEIMPAAARTSSRVHARVVAGDPATEISRVAAEVAADMIMVGVTRHGAIGRLLFGSTANRVMRNSGREVLAMPQLAA
jgi:nucleotide-binding universal stress UspA family protein